MNFKYIYIVVKLFLINILIIFGYGCTSTLEEDEQLVEYEKTEFSLLFNKATNRTFSKENRKANLIKAYEINTTFKVDSLRIKNLKKIAYTSLQFEDSIFFYEVNNKALENAVRNKDTAGMAEIQWNFGEYYNERDIYHEAYTNYYKAYANYKAINNEYFSAKMLYNMAFIRGRLKDYTGSEKLTIRAIVIFERLDKNSSLYNSFNHMAILYYDLEEYDKALIYNNKAFEYLKRTNLSGIEYQGLLNNLGLIYHQKKDYNKAVEYFTQALVAKDSILKYDKLLYSRLIDNRAYSKLLLLNYQTDILPQFNEALSIRENKNDYAGIIISKLHLAEYYLVKGDTATSLDASMKAMTIAKHIDNNRDYLASLKVLAKIDTPNSGKYLNDYINLSDSLHKKERRTRNKYLRIDYETDEYIEKAEKLSREKILLVAVTIFLLLIFLLLYFISQQRAKSRKLIFESSEQKANEQIYLLSLEQQDKFQKVKIQERNRISEELHDGILGKLFGTRMGLGFLVMQNPKGIEDKLDVFIAELQEVEREIRDISHELKDDSLHETNIGFLTLVDNLIKNRSDIGNFEYTVIKSDSILWYKVDEKIKANLYRIIQEALQNIIKYAKAKNVLIRFIIKKNNLILIIKDDGVGFEISIRRKGIGIENMNSRVEKLNGKFHIKSKINEGTKVKILIPLLRKNGKSL